MRKIFRDGFFRKGRADIGKIFRLARNDANIGMITLVAAAAIGQRHQWHFGHLRRLRRRIATRRANDCFGIKSAIYRHLDGNDFISHMHGHLNIAFGRQAGKQPHYGRHLWPVTRQPAGARRHCCRRRGRLAHQHIQRLGVFMFGGKFQHHLPRAARPAMRAVTCFCAHDLNAGFGKIGHIHFTEHAAAALEYRLAGFFRLRGRINPADGMIHAKTETIFVCCGCFITIRRRKAFGVTDAHLVLAGLLDFHG